jgi:hypothetical protein
MMDYSSLPHYHGKPKEIGRQPDHIEDTAFGTLTWDGKLRMWRGCSTMANGTSFPLCICTLSDLIRPRPADEAMWDRTITDKSRATLPLVQRSDSALRIVIAKDSWPDFQRWGYDEVAYSAMFQKRLKLNSVTFLADGGAEIYYDDDGMIGGHLLVAYVEPDGVVRGCNS